MRYESTIRKALSKPPNKWDKQTIDQNMFDKDFLRQELLKQGTGYCEFIQFLDTKFLKGNRILVSQILSDQLDPPLHNPLEQIIDTSDPFEYLTV